MTESITIAIQRFSHSEGLSLPTYQTEGSAGMDLAAAVTEPLILQPGRRSLVPTGIAIALPRGYEAQVRPRSGLAIRHGVTCLNTPGTIDSDYRGEIQVVMINLGEEDFTIERGDRIAQMIIGPVVKANWREVELLEDSDRGAGGFGHTGT